MPRLRAIIFDLDDTLYLERDYVRSGFRAVAGRIAHRLHLSANAVYDELAALYESGERRRTFNRWLEARGADDDAFVAELLNVYRTHRPTIAVLPGVPELLDRLGTDYLLGLLSDGYESVQRLKLDALAIASAFEVVIFSDSMGRDAWKPSPKPYEAVMTALGVSGPEAVYVADNPAKDFIGARRVGMWSIRVREPEGVYRELEPVTLEYAPDDDVLGLSELERVLAALSS